MAHSYGVGVARFGFLSAGLVITLVLWAATATAVARNPHSVRRLAFDISEAAPTRRVRGVVSRGWAATSSLRARLRVEEIAGSALLAGLVAVLLMGIGFTALLDDVLEGDGVARIDQPAAHGLAVLRDRWLTELLVLVTQIGGPVGQTVLMSSVCLITAIRAKSWSPLILGLIGGVGAGVVVVSAKALVGRPRPASPYAVIAEHGYSFPSGHATGVAAVLLICAWLLCRWVTHTWGGRVTLCATAIGVIGLVGFSRIYLGVHYVTDVLAGWLLGAAWAATVILVGSWITRRR